ETELQCRAAVAIATSALLSSTSVLFNRRNLVLSAQPFANPMTSLEGGTCTRVVFHDISGSEEKSTSHPRWKASTTFWM
ncbi:hypothetical protein Bhyg_06058, partial [Pseudolycoriella hygida]